jgi:adenylyltransferase/sulfurtransferase
MDDSQLLRYSRQVLLPQIDVEGQQKLLNARVFIIGMGGLGSPAAMYLAAAGVGTLVINDFDRVDITNLQRQIIHNTGAIGSFKAESARETLQRLNPEVRIEIKDHKLEFDELLLAISNCDAVLDCSDNFASRFLINRAAVQARVPLISGAAIRFEGQITTFDARLPDSPCYQCLYADIGELEESCATNGVVAPLPGILGSMQAMEAIKILLGVGKPLIGRLVLLDALSMEWTQMRFRKDPRCPVCSP